MPNPGRVAMIIKSLSRASSESAGHAKSGEVGMRLVEAGRAADVPGHPCIAGGSGRLPRLSRRLRDLRQRRLRQNDNVGADLHALVEIGYVVVGEADAAARHLLADGGRIVGAVYAGFGAAEIHRARSERIAGAAGGIA